MIAAKQGGKIKTVLQTLALGALVLPLREVDGTLGTVTGALWWVAAVAMGAAVAATVWTGFEFFKDAFAQRRDQRSAASV